MKATAKSSVQLSPRLRLTAIAASPADVVRAAGGWLFDQSMAGWDVSVLTCGPADPRPLRILGARTYNLDLVLASPLTLGPCLQGVVVPADLYDRDERVRKIAASALSAGAAEVRLWGGRDTTRAPGTVAPVRHQLSIAARAFKARALAAADVHGEAADDVEVFRSLSPGPCPSVMAIGIGSPS
jgi:hypothetical protein